MAWIVIIFKDIWWKRNEYPVRIKERTDVNGK